MSETAKRSTVHVLLAGLVALFVAGGPVAGELHAVLFHGGNSFAFKCQDHTHAELDHAGDAGLNDPDCVAHPPAAASRLITHDRVADVRPLRRSGRGVVASNPPTVLVAFAYHSRAPPLRA